MDSAYASHTPQPDAGSEAALAHFESVEAEQLSSEMELIQRGFSATQGPVRVLVANPEAEKSFEALGGGVAALLKPHLVENSGDWFLLIYPAACIQNAWILKYHI